MRKLLSMFLTPFTPTATSNGWKGKNWLSYGDSITEQGNTGAGYQRYVKNALGISNSYPRGIGAQRYTYVEDGGMVCFLDATGKLHSYDLTQTYDNYKGTIPSGTTKVRGCFSSWSRIKASIPDSIRNTIDLITLMGGTNDIEYWGSNGGVGNDMPVWSSANKTDKEWLADTQYYNGGDYDITTFGGAMASTIMKMKVRCPNALIVVVTPWGYWNKDTHNQWAKTGLTLYELSTYELRLARYMSCEAIDLNGRSNVNAWGYNNFVDAENGDYLHPNKNGRKAIARVLIEGLNIISPL